MFQNLYDSRVGEGAGIPLHQAEVCWNEVILVGQPQILMEATVTPLLYTWFLIRTAIHDHEKEVTPLPLSASELDRLRSKTRMFSKETAAFINVRT